MFACHLWNDSSASYHLATLDRVPDQAYAQVSPAFSHCANIEHRPSFATVILFSHVSTSRNIVSSVDHVDWVQLDCEIYIRVGVASVSVGAAGLGVRGTKGVRQSVCTGLRWLHGSQGVVHLRASPWDNSPGLFDFRMSVWSPSVCNHMAQFG